MRIVENPLFKRDVFANKIAKIRNNFQKLSPNGYTEIGEGMSFNNFFERIKKKIPMPIIRIIMITG